MIAYKIQLWYVIRDKIQSQTKSGPGHNPVQDKVQEKYFLSEKKIVRKKFCLGCCLGFPVCKVSCLGQIDVYHQFSGTYIPQ